MAITGRTRRTVLRWIRCGRVGDPAALQLLQLVCFGLVPGDAWRGWRVHGRDLVSPEGDLWRLEDLRAASISASTSARWTPFETAMRRTACGPLPPRSADATAIAVMSAARRCMVFARRVAAV